MGFPKITNHVSYWLVHSRALDLIRWKKWTCRMQVPWMTGYQVSEKMRLAGLSEF